MITLKEYVKKYGVKDDDTIELTIRTIREIVQYHIEQMLEADLKKS